MTRVTAPGPDPILSTLRDTDRDRYLLCLLAPADRQAGLAALYAFHAEIARLRDVVREALPGEIRLQWWRDLLDAAPTDTSSGHPLASALIDCVVRYRLPVNVLQDMIDARVFDLYDDPMESRSALEGYAGETASALIQLSCLILDPDTASASATAAGHAGVAQTIAGLMLLMPLHRSRGQVYVPADLLTATGLDRDTFLAGTDKAAIGRAISAFAGLGREHLERARAAATSISPANAVSFAGISLVEPILGQAEKLGADVLEGRLTPAPQWRRQWRLWRAARSRRF